MDSNELGKLIVVRKYPESVNIVFPATLLDISISSEEEKVPVFVYLEVHYLGHTTVSIYDRK